MQKTLPEPHVAIVGCLLALFVPGATLQRADAQLVLSGNETKIDLTSGSPRVVRTAEPDSISILDFSQHPPKVEHLFDIPNSVIGPPSNIAITPDHSLALIANSLRIDPADATRWIPDSYVHLLNLRTSPPRVVGRVTTDAQPSGISIAPNGRLALVANRAAGTLSILAISHQTASNIGTVKVCEPSESVSDVAIAPDGKLALASVQKGGYLAVLRIDGTEVSVTGQKVSVYGQPYRVVIAPDGRLCLTAGQGFGNGLDHDAITVIDLRSKPIRAIDHISVGVVPESIEISPDGRMLAAVLMNGSNLPPTDPNHNPKGELVILKRTAKSFQVSQRLPIGAIPEGVAFTSDGRHLVVQCHPERELWVFPVKNGRVKNAPDRIAVPGMPSSLRAAP